jgi:alpha-D-ribose 1-methylphosphonate 5-triphosphate synthase subunit PhnG
LDTLQNTMTALSSVAGLTNAFHGASATISRATAGASQDAAAIASANGMQDPSAMLAALVDARQQLLYTQAGAKMMSTANAMLGSIIDISA